MILLAQALLAQVTIGILQDKQISTWLYLHAFQQWKLCH
jgi:hypothetical protein